MKNLPWAVLVEDLTVAYHTKPVLWDIDLKIPQGKIMAIVGPNGAGKSTLIKAMLGLIKPLSGFVQFNLEKNDACLSNCIAYVPQSGSVDWDFPASVADVVLMGRYGQLGWFKRPGKLDKEIAEHALVEVGMQDFANRQISQLSGGQQQRVFLARALAQEAEIYFMDEPFKGVDAKSERAIAAVLRKMQSEGKTMIIVHHDLHSVKEYFDWITLLNLRLIEYGPVEEVFNEENLLRTYRSSIELLRENGHV